MFRLCVFVALAVCLTSAQENATDGMPPPAFAPESVMMQVQMEEMISRRYLDVVMKFQHAQFTMQAGQLWAKNIMEDEDVMELDEDESRNELLASYFMMRAVSLRHIQSVFTAGDVQKEFFMDRAMQYFVQQAGGSSALPPQILQVFYFKTYATMLKTLRLSYQFQYLAHFKTWLEDELDINVSFMEGAENFDSIWDDAEDDIIRDKLYAFHAYYTFSFLDFQIFYLDQYLQMMFMGMSGSLDGQQPEQQQASFLEVESEPSINPAMGAMGSMTASGSMGGGSTAYMRWYHIFQLYFQLQSAQSGFMSSNLEAKAYGLLNDDEDENDGDGEDHMEMAAQWFGGFAQNTMYAGQLEYMTSMLEIMAMYAPMVAGSMGSMGSTSMASN